jgi:ATP-binding cassette subfamily B protein
VRLKLASPLHRVRWGPLLRAYRLFGPHVLRYRLELLGALLCLLGSIAMDIVQPWPLKLVFDAILPLKKHKEHLLPDAIASALPADPLALLLVVCAAVVVIAALSGLLDYGQNLLAAQVAHKVIFRIRRDLFAHVQRLPMAFHARRETGDLLMRLTGDVQMLREILITSVITLVARLFLLAGMVLVMVWMSPKLTLVALAVIPALVLVLLRFSGRLRDVTRRARRKEGKVASVITETINTISVVQSFSRERFEDERLERQNRSSLRAGLTATRLEEAMARAVEVAVALGTCGVLALGTRLTLGGEISPGDLLVFLTYVRNFYKPLKDLSRLSARLSKASICAERILDLRELEPAIADAPDAVAAPRFAGAVQFRDVGLRYEEGSPPALSGIDLDVRPGETLLMVGTSGAGKTSIASLLLRLYDPTEGSVLIDGTDIRRYTLESLREQIAVVLQESVLFGATVRENIAYGKPEAGLEEIVAAARLVNAHEFIERLPAGYETVLGERGVTLSGGQRQRIALARAAIKKAPILILDEPTTGLDAPGERAVIDGMRALLGGATTFVITHRPELFPEADRIVVLEAGRLVESGTWQDLVRSRGAFFRLASKGAGAPEPPREVTHDAL